MLEAAHPQRPELTSSKLGSDTPSWMISLRRTEEVSGGGLLDLPLDSHTVLASLRDSLQKRMKRMPSAFVDHTERVTRYAVGIGKCFGLKEIELRILEIAAQFHDVDKTEWNKKSPDIVNLEHIATDREFGQIIKPHPRRSALALWLYAKELDIEEHPAVQVVIQAADGHHIHFNGRGYPASHGEPNIITKIITVADSLDAMTTRPYKPERFCNVEAAKVEVIACMGTQFDPVLQDAFITWFDANCEEINNGLDSLRAQYPLLERQVGGN